MVEVITVRSGQERVQWLVEFESVGGLVLGKEDKRSVLYQEGGEGGGMMMMFDSRQGMGREGGRRIRTRKQSIQRKEESIQRIDEKIQKEEERTLGCR